MTKDDQQRQPRHDHSGVHHFLLISGLAGLALLRKANMLRQAYVAISSISPASSDDWIVVPRCDARTTRR